MNKTVLVALCTLASLISADALIDAIDKKDLKKVVSMVKQKEYNPALYFQYLTAAQDSLTSARDNYFIQKMRPQSSTICAIIASAFALWNGYNPVCDIINLNNKICLNAFQMTILNNAWNQVYITAVCTAIILAIGTVSIDNQKDAELKSADMIYKIMIRCRESFYIESKGLSHSK